MTVLSAPGHPRASHRWIPLAALLIASLCAAPARAQDAPGSTSGQFDTEQRRADEQSEARSREFDNRANQVFNDQAGDRRAGQDFPQEYNARFDGIPIFFPPATPYFLMPLPDYNPAGGWPAPPVEMAPYIAEPFYPPLATRIDLRELTRKNKAALEAYTVAKLAAQRELTDKLDSLAKADPVRRRSELAAFAADQAPRLAALEASAEKLRGDLIGTSFLYESADWNITRNWTLPGALFDDAEDALRARFQVIRAAAYYVDGLGPAQRGLLREVAMELGEGVQRMAAAQAPGAPQTGGDNPLLFFSPETARIRLPAGLSASLAGRVSDYERRKSQLKLELQEAVVAYDSTLFNGRRRRAMEELTARQAPEIEALEKLADDIRDALAPLPDFRNQPELPPLPPALANRLIQHTRARLEAQRSLQKLVHDIREKIEVTRVRFTRGQGGRRVLTITPADPMDEVALAPVKEMIVAHQRVAEPRTSFIENEIPVIRAEFARLIQAPNSPYRGRSLEDALDEAALQVERSEEWVSYGGYRTALFEPGLSVAQRRLLFDQSLQSLHLPLPSLSSTVRSMRGSR